MVHGVSVLCFYLRKLSVELLRRTRISRLQFTYDSHTYVWPPLNGHFYTQNQNNHGEDPRDAAAILQKICVFAELHGTESKLG